MNILARTITTTVFTLVASSAYACDYPSHPNNLPDGATAGKEEMIAGVKMINAYQESMGEYLSCIEAAHIVATQSLSSDDKETRKQHKDMFNKKYNAAVNEQTLWVEEFNAQIRAYKAKGK